MNKLEKMFRNYERGIIDRLTFAWQVAIEWFETQDAAMVKQLTEYFKEDNLFLRTFMALTHIESDNIEEDAVTTLRRLFP